MARDRSKDRHAADRSGHFFRVQDPVWDGAAARAKGEGLTMGQLIEGWCDAYRARRLDAATAARTSKEQPALLDRLSLLTHVYKSPVEQGHDGSVVIDGIDYRLTVLDLIDDGLLIVGHIDKSGTAPISLTAAGADTAGYIVACE